MKLSSSPSPGRRAAPRVLRVEYNGMPYDWLNLDEMGPRVAHSEQFIATLRDNIVRYFKVPVEVQVCCDEDGPLVSAWDFLRVLQSVSPLIRIFDLREMPSDVKMQVSKKLAAIQAEAGKLQDGLGLQGGVGGSVSPWRGGANGASYTGGTPWGTPQRGLSPAPARGAFGAGEAVQPASPLLGSSLGGGAPAGFGAPPAERAAPPSGPPGGFGAGGFGAGSSSGPPDDAGAPCGARVGAAVAPGAFAGISTSAPGVPRSTRTTGDLFEVKLQRTGLGKYGFGIQPTLDNRAASIDRIDPDGILARWNMENPAQAVKIGDTLVCVNGVSDSLDDMEQELRTANLSMLFEPC